MTYMSSASSLSDPAASAISSPTGSRTYADSEPPSPDVFHESREDYFNPEDGNSNAETQSSPPTPTDSRLPPVSSIDSASAYGGDTCPTSTANDGSSANISIVSYFEHSFRSYLENRKEAKEQGLYGLSLHADHQRFLRSARTDPCTVTDMDTETKRYFEELSNTEAGTVANDRAHFEHGIRMKQVENAHLNRLADADLWLDRDGNIVHPPDSDEEDEDQSQVSGPEHSSMWSSASGIVGGLGAAYQSVSSMFRSSRG